MAEMLTCVLMWLGRRVAARAICLSFQIGPRSRTFAVSPLLALLVAILDLSVQDLAGGINCVVFLDKIGFDLSSLFFF